ncbi:MAG: serine/threonine-protein kinase [Gemmataceae bacterium]
MLTTDLGACEWFVWDLRRSNLIDRGQLDQVIGEFLTRNPGAEPPLLADFLVKKGYLTEFQAERLLQGKTQGFVLGPFTLMDALGAGSMGTVYKAQSKNDSRWFAVKVLPRRSMWNVRIARRKVRLFEQAQHPSVVPFVDVGTAGGMHYLAWPLVEGRSLDKIVQEQGKLSVELTAQYALQTAEGLYAAHQANLFHGLLKPSNLMLGSDGTLRILDFGIGCLLAETEGESLVDTMSTANSVNSGLDCASPESIMDPTNLNAIGDQYSLGCVMYFCLTGRYPFPDGTAVEKMMCHQHKQPLPIPDLTPDVPVAMLEIVEKLMAKNPAERYPSCAEVIELLRPLAHPATTNSRSNQGTYRRPTMQMPRVTLPPSNQGASPAPPTPAPVEDTAAEMARPQQRPVQPLPGRAPSANLPPRAPAPAAGRPAPAAPVRPLRPSDQGGREQLRPAVNPRQPQPAPVQYEEEPAPVAHHAPAPAPQPPASGGQYSLVTVVLLAVLAGVAAFFLSRLIPM